MLWTLVVWLWIIATRVPAMQKAQIDPQSAARTGVLADKLPPEVMYVSDNYNHLMGAADDLLCGGARGAGRRAGRRRERGARVDLRDPARRALTDPVHGERRGGAFAMFALSTIALAVLTIRVALAVF